MPTWWNLVSAIVAGVTPIVVASVSVGMYYVKTTVHLANNEQLEKLREMYIPSMNSKITGREIEQVLNSSKEDLEKLKEDFSRLELYAHTRVHDISNLLQVSTFKASEIK